MISYDLLSKVGGTNLFEMLKSRTGRLTVTAHKGASGYAPENTMPAFIKALETGADIVELDVHLTRDRRCVVIHDDHLDRTTEGSGPIWEHNWNEIKRLDAGSWFDHYNAARRLELSRADLPLMQLPIPAESFAGTRLPLLEEVLEWAKAAGMPVAIEIKTPWPFYYGLDRYSGLVEAVLELVERHGDDEITTMHSFDHRAMLRVKELNPNITTVVSYTGALMVDPFGPVRAARANGIAIGSNWATVELISAAHAEDFNFFGWGLGEDPYNQAADLCRLVQMGVDYVSGAYPDILRKVVEAC